MRALSVVYSYAGIGTCVAALKNDVSSSSRGRTRLLPESRRMRLHLNVGCITGLESWLTRSYLTVAHVTKHAPNFGRWIDTPAVQVELTRALESIFLFHEISAPGYFLILDSLVLGALALKP